MGLLLITMVLALPAAEPNEAEKLFLDMDKKITSAKTLSYDLEVKLESGDKKMSGKGSVILGEGNRGRTEWKVTLDGKSTVMVTVSDGMKMDAVSDDMTQKLETPKAFGELNRAAASRSGILVLGLFVRTAAIDDFKVADFSTSDFKLGKKENVGGSEAQEIQYTLKMPGMKDPIPVNLWIDSKTTLPIKRVLAATVGSEKITFTETYSKFTPGAKVDPKTFEVK